MEELDLLNTEGRELPLIALRGKVLLPKTLLNFDVGRPMSVTAAQKALDGDSLVVISSQKNSVIDNPTVKDIYYVGVLAKIKHVIKNSENNLKLSVQALERVKICEFTSDKGCFTVKVEYAPYTCSADETTVEAHYRVAKNSFYEYSLFDGRITKEVVNALSDMANPDDFIDNALSVIPFKENAIQSVLEIDDTVLRLDAFSSLLQKELEIAKIEKNVANSVRSSIDKSQKEFYLREQIKAIHAELGDNEDDGETLLKKIKNKKFPKEIEEKALKEVARLDKINPASPDYSIILNYLDWLTELPFNEKTVDNPDILKAKEILDGDHFGLEKVKERILEYIAVLHLTKKVKGPILCFVGPPGVGKTSVASSIARALGRKFVRMSLGGLKDEAEIRGHRRTYVGAMPGRIIYGIKNAGVSNPVFLLDEIDKLSSDIHGDPASALLEVLDPEQNVSFRDRYMEVPYDLSDVIFITTANSMDTIPYPLLDRMEIIELGGYTNEEKREIAKRYLIPKAIKNNGLTDKKIAITDGGIDKIIKCYTLEAGVRNLEREINAVVRKAAVAVAENPKTRKKTVTENNLSEYLGREKRIADSVMEKSEIGAATGLAWTSFGGTTLTIEVGLIGGKGDIILTGKLGDVMKESARAAVTYIKAHAVKYGIDPKRFENTDIHIHVPEGATPKDGPSAGITMATAILSAFAEKPVKNTVAMTGEITLRGKVLPIGGLKEKSLAAFRLGIKNVIIPKDNEKDTEDIPEEIRKEINFIPVSDVNEVFEKAIEF